MNKAITIKAANEISNLFQKYLHEKYLDDMYYRDYSVADEAGCKEVADKSFYWSCEHELKACEIELELRDSFGIVLREEGRESLEHSIFRTKRAINNRKHIWEAA